MDESRYENSAVAFLADIRAGVRRSRAAVVAMAVVSVLAVAVSLAYVYVYTATQREQIYVIDQGSVLSATRTSGMPQKDMEIEDHVRRFHQLMYNLAPNIDMINANVRLALELCDESGFEFYSDLKEKQYYARLININAVQQIQVDSVKIDMESYPYHVDTYCSLFVLRESNISKYDYRTSCDVVDVPRSSKNPHGLIMQRFLETRHEFLGTRRSRGTGY